MWSRCEAQAINSRSDAVGGPISDQWMAVKPAYLRNTFQRGDKFMSTRKFIRGW
jgi:hypothetical protein